MILVLMNRNSSGWSFAVVLKRTVTDYSIFLATYHALL